MNETLTRNEQHSSADDIADYEAGLQRLIEAGQPAENVYADAVARFPDHAPFSVEFAWQAYHRQDWPTALQRWRIVRERFPDYMRAYLGEAAALEAAGQHAEADARLEHVMLEDPTNPSYAVTYARLAADRGDAAAAVDRWARMRDRFPDEPIGYTLGAVALFEVERADAAEALLSEASRRFPEFDHHPDGLPLILDYLRWGLNERNWELAASRLGRLYAVFPHVSEVALVFATACRHSLSWETAMAVLRDAVARCPDDPALLAELVNIHALSGDLATALRVAREADAAFPGRMDIQERISQIEFRIAHAALDTAEQVTSPAVAVPARTEPAVVMSAFESLGAGCTFGYVQRSFGAEPMGLLRWGGMAFPDMLRALDDQFAHLAEDGNVALMASEMVHVPMGGREYIAIDQIYNLTSHTFIPVSDNEDVEKLRHAVVRKMRLLGRVLLSELRKGQKVFLYKDARRHLTEADVQALHDRIRRYGDSALLYVRPNPPDVGDYSLQARGDKLLFATLPEEYLVEHRVRENQPWLTLCTEVLRITA